MVNLIPSTIPRSTKSKGEKDLFKIFYSDKKYNDWFVIHSQDIIERQDKWMGECDYIVIIPKKGIVCIEIKSCREPYPKVTNEGWFYNLDQEERNQPDVDGPFVQVKNFTQDLRRDLIKYFNELRSTIITRLVLFTDSPFNLKTTEWLDFEYYDVDHLGEKKEKIFLCILNTIEKFRLHCVGKDGFGWFSNEETQTPSPIQAEKILKRLRPRYENFLTPQKRQEKLYKELKTYTEEQYEFFDAHQFQDRILVNSPAGTGKTVLAIESARRSENNEEKTLFVCFNKMLGNYIAKEMEFCKEFVTFKTFSKLLIELAGIPINEINKTYDFWNSLTDKAFDGIENSYMNNYFDHLIIDEAQDIIEPNNIMILSSLLKKGFNENKLTIFGDFEWQSLYDFKRNNIEDPLVAEHGKLIHEKLSPEKIKSEYCNDLAILTPRINCRNTPSVSQQAEMYGGMNPGYRRCLRNDDGIIPLIKTYKNRNEQLKLIIDVIEKLKKEKYENHEIVMLSFTSLDESVNSFLNSDHDVKFLSSKYTDWKKKGVVFCASIRSFKGLESPVVIITDIPGEKMNEKISKSLLYTGITRSIDKLILLVNDNS